MDVASGPEPAAATTDGRRRRRPAARGVGRPRHARAAAMATVRGCAAPADVVGGPAAAFPFVT
jgi:hypothetical protein